MKSAIWLYIFLFIAFFDLHAQYPILTPFAISIGAAPSFIGLMMGMYSITHLPGNLLASVAIDRYGSRHFIAASLLLAGVILIIQSYIDDPWHLLILRSISGFVLAFLSPACLSLLAKLSKDLTEQGKLMAGNGLVHTLASVVSPAAGAFLVAKMGFSTAFMVLGWILIVTAVCALIFIKDISHDSSSSSSADQLHEISEEINDQEHAPSLKTTWLVFLIPLGLSCAQGILNFELPLMKAAISSVMTTGLLFSIVSIGALITLSMLFLNRLKASKRTIYGTLALSLLYFGLAIDAPIPFFLMLLLIGMLKGIVLPALSLWLIELSGGKRYGRTFSILAIASSIGAFLGPMLAGQMRDFISPYFISFFVLMIGLAFLPIFNTPTSLQLKFSNQNHNLKT